MANRPPARHCCASGLVDDHMSLRVFIGWDRRELLASQVCARSMTRNASQPLDLRPLILPHLQATGLYCRPTEIRGTRLFDIISQHPMATDHALTRFLVPELAGRKGWALFCDGDILWRGDVAELFGVADPKYAVMVVKHDHKPPEVAKMDGQVQAQYECKNWSSVILWNCAHPANAALRVGAVNTKPGLWLHQFRWLAPELIGALPVEWNWLAGYSEPIAAPKAVHFTKGTPDMTGHYEAPYADEWRAVAKTIPATQPSAKAA